MSQAPLGQLVNFLAATRKTRLVPSNYFSPNDSTSWIWDIPANAFTTTPTMFSGTIDGVNASFVSLVAVINGISVYKNGVLQDPATMYTLAGSTVTFTPFFIPQPGDSLLAIVS